MITWLTLVFKEQHDKKKMWASAPFIARPD